MARLDHDRRITVSGRTWAKRHKRDFAAVITCEDPDARWGLRFWRDPKPDHLVLRFVDLDTPAPPPHDVDLRFRLATREQVEQAIAFGRDRESLLIHCQVGVARSTAIALAILADRHGAGQERESLDALLAFRPVAVPNLHVVGLADAILGRNGRLLDTVVAWDRELPDNQTRRKDNRRAHFRYHGLHIDE